MPKPTYSTQIRAEYQRLFDTCVINPDRYTEVDEYIKKIRSAESRYKTVAQTGSIPWYFIGLIHCMESDCDFTTHLHNGDSLTARTIHEPIARPVNGNPPFTWEFSAEDALQYEKLNRWTDWSIPGILYKLEGYNGYGYRYLKAPYTAIHSPYLWCGSNQYTRGKFVKDGLYSANAVSKQPGAAVLLRRLFEKQIITNEIDRISLIQQLGDEVKYAPSRYVVKAAELQRQLNQHGAILKIDGRAGRLTSDAYRVIIGRYLTGDPKA